MATDTTTAGTADPTLEGKSGDGQGNSDQVIAGLNRSLNKQVEENKRLAAEVAKFAQEPEKDPRGDKLERENKSLKTFLKYPDVAQILQKAVEKGVDPDLLDDDFVAALRAGTSKPNEETVGTPAHNPVRQTSPESPADVLKRVTSIFSD